MPNEKYPSLSQTIIEPMHQRGLGFPIKIDHDIPTKDTVEWLLKRKRLHEIKSPEIDILLHLVLYLHKTVPPMVSS
jgi:hypothetical protein